MRMQRQPEGTYTVDGLKFGSAEEAAAFIDRNPAPAGAAPARSSEQGVPREQRSASKWPWVMGVPIGLFALFMIYGSIASNTPEGREKSRQRGAIELCWKEQGRKSLDPGTQRFVAGTCEMMESKFRERFHVEP